MARKSKEGKKQGKAPVDPNDPSSMSRRQQMVATYKMTKQTDRWVGLWMLGALLLAGGGGFALFWVLPPGGDLGVVFAVIGGLMLGLLALLIVFSRRAQRAAYARLEGQLGAAANALMMLRRGWTTKPAIAFTKQQDVVHRVVGPPGIVLVGEGNPHRLRQLVTSEQRKHERVAADTPIHVVLVGHNEGQVPLPKLAKHVTKLGRQVKPAQITDVLNRIKALDAQRSAIPLPKGPIPTSMKGMRGNLRGR